MRTRAGAVFGHVYLMYDKRSGKNCVAAIKTAYRGQRTVTGAILVVKGGARSADAGRYRYYAETGHLSGAWKCVRYEGWTKIVGRGHGAGRPQGVGQLPGLRIFSRKLSHQAGLSRP